MRINGIIIPIIRKWGHLFFNTNCAENATFFTK